MLFKNDVDSVVKVLTSIINDLSEVADVHSKRAVDASVRMRNAEIQRNYEDSERTRAIRIKNKLEEVLA
jgi:hypothetical protein